MEALVWLYAVSIGDMGIIEKKMETTLAYRGYIRLILGLGKRTWKHYSTQGLYKGYLGIVEKMETTIVRRVHIRVFFG